MQYLTLSQKEFHMIKSSIKTVFDEPELEDKEEAKVLFSLLSKLGIDPKDIGITNPTEFLAELD
jgi:hypothetical protein